MPFIDPSPRSEADGDGERSPNYERAFSDRPELYAAWQQLIGAIKARMAPQRYELATLAAARRLGSSYCMLAHGMVLAELLGAERVAAIAGDHRTAGLEDVDVGVMDLAEKVAADARSVTQADIDRLRVHGLSDAEIFDVVTAAAARCFFSTTLDALGVQADARFAAVEPQLREALTVGRPIAQR